MFAPHGRSILLLCYSPAGQPAQCPVSPRDGNSDKRETGLEPDYLNMI